MKRIRKPAQNEYAMYYDQYLEDLDAGIVVLDALKSSAQEIVKLVSQCSEQQLITPYAVGKWTIKDIIMHLLDTERVFLYRAMRFARNDRKSLPFFDENAFAENAMATKLNTKRLIKEFKTQRTATICFFDNLNTTQLKRKGIASQFNMSVRACVWIILAHELHHIKIIKERYLQIS